MAKKKQFLQPRRKPDNKKSTGPETANEYLEAGVDFEEAGEKWRAGDAAKTLRFFLRAIDNYDAGLRRFSDSFDLAYNKARIQYEVAQQPRLLEHLPTPLLDLLQIALDSHRYALRIDQDNADLLLYAMTAGLRVMKLIQYSNTAQVLTSLAECLTEGKRLSEDCRNGALKFLQESMELFQRCLSVQEFQFTQAQESSTVPEKQPQPLATDDSDYSYVASGNASDTPQDEVWASIVEPITKDTLLDTIVAQLETMIAVCSLEFSGAHGDLTWMEEYFSSTLQDKLTSYTSGSANCHQAILAKAKFACALSEAAFRGGRLDLPTYERELDAAFSSEDLQLFDDPQKLCDKADAELNFNSSIEFSLRAVERVPLPEELKEVSNVRWKHITKALDSLTAASKLPNAQNLARIHLRRGDCELLRLRLGDAPTRYELAMKSASTLLKNAEIYYRLAARLAANEGAQEEAKEAKIKESIAVSLGGNAVMSPELQALTKSPAPILEIAEEMREEGLLGDEAYTRLVQLLT